MPPLPSDEMPNPATLPFDVTDSASSNVSDMTVVAQTTVPAEQTLSPGLPTTVQDESSDPGAGQPAPLGGGGAGGPLAGGGPGSVVGGAAGGVPPQAKSNPQMTTANFRTVPLDPDCGATWSFASRPAR